MLGTKLAWRRRTAAPHVLRVRSLLARSATGCPARTRRQQVLWGACGTRHAGVPQLFTGYKWAASVFSAAQRKLGVSRVREKRGLFLCI